MSEPWVKVFLRNGQFETASQKKKKEEDHLYNYLINKYRNIFDIPDSPVKKTPKLHSRTKSKTISAK